MTTKTRPKIVAENLVEFLSDTAVQLRDFVPEVK